MNQRLQEMRDRIRKGMHKSHRQTNPLDLASDFDAEGLSWPQRVARLTRSMCEAEKVIIDPNERIIFTRTLPDARSLYTVEDWSKLTKNRTLHELGPINNICPDWPMVLSQGLLGRRKVALESRKLLAHDPEAVVFLDCAIETIDSVLDLAARHATTARQIGQFEIARIFENVPARCPRSFREALQSLRLLHAVVCFSGHYQVGLGRFDQYMWPYLQKDLETSVLNIDSAEELLAEFFISLNKDSDLFPGVQPGDNGQTIIVGGVKPDGSDGCNELTRMVLRVGEDVAMIDPKINLRITSNTDLDLLFLATKLTKKGLGFPQYSNDDVAIPALVSHGYDLEDARDYTVAACWEFIIPGKGMEIVNIGAVSFPAAADKAIREGLAAHDNFAGIMKRVSSNIHDQVENLADAYSLLLLPPAPFFSVLMDGPLEQGRDLSKGLKYNNFGIHGACSANASDGLAAVKQFVFIDKSVNSSQLLDALNSNYERHDSLRLKLINEGPKVGKNSDLADKILVDLFNDFADACEAYEDNGRGGIIRPGSGSAMYYMWLARGNPGMREPIVGATADGRNNGDFFSANLAPSPGIHADGPISIFQSFSKIDYHRICNGGPITIELSDSVFRNPESIRKVALLVRTFAQLGCQQLQLNSLNAETLIDAKAHPERHMNLIVRVWGWSGYFCELAPEYQDQIINRSLYGIN